MAALRGVTCGGRTIRRRERTNGACAIRAQASEPRIAVFSSARWTVQAMEEPVMKAFPGSTFYEARLSNTTANLARDHNVVCLFVNDDCGEEVVHQLADNGVGLIAMRCAGFDRVDLKACKERGVRVVRVPTYSPYAVAEHAVGLIMALNRKIHKANARVQQGNFSISGLEGFDVHGKTVGVVGTGQIGAVFCKIMAGFGVNVLAYDVKENSDALAAGAQYTDLDTLLGESDIVSLHCPLNKSTYHLIDDNRVAKMKKGAMLINVSRGGLVDSRAVIEGLKSGRIGAVGMDVYEHEHGIFFRDFTQQKHYPITPEYDETFAVLSSFPNVLITPHTAFLTTEALEAITSTTISNIREWAAKPRSGEPFSNEVLPPDG